MIPHWNDLPASQAAAVARSGPLTICRSNLDCGVGEVCRFGGTCGAAENPATAPLSCTCAAAGQGARDLLGGAMTALLAVAAVVRRGRRGPRIEQRRAAW